MKETLEVRWFYDGAPPEVVVAWFMHLDPNQQSNREDLYLITNDPSLNVKLREGKIQVKRRMGEPEAMAFHEDVRGRRESWQKWSFPLADDRFDLFRDAPSEPWLAVEKRRYQRIYTPEEQRTLVSRSSVVPPAEALVELTRVRSGDVIAWTICMEAEGPASALPDTLRQMGKYIFEQDTPPPLDAQHSYGYVEWLKQAHMHSAAHENQP